MRIITLVVILCMLVVPFTEGSVLDSLRSSFFQFSNGLLNRLGYDMVRRNVIQAEKELMTGGMMKLSAKEEIANNILGDIKREEMEVGFQNPGLWPASQHFFTAKPLIENSKVFQILRLMPKGAVLHAHNTAMLSSKAFVEKLIPSFPEMLYCKSSRGMLVLTFRKMDYYQCDRYINIQDAAETNPNIYLEIEKSINLYLSSTKAGFDNINDVWSRFQKMFDTVEGAFRYEPFYRKYHQLALEEFYNDGVMYIELRTSYGELYNQDGSTLSNVQTMEVLKEVVEKFKMTNPDFLGVKVIYSTNRRVGPLQIQQKLDSFRSLRDADPFFNIGFDLVGQEDLGRPLLTFKNELNKVNADMNFFFHAGETNWYGWSTDWNILDAILWNTTRIGHGYALIKHPLLWQTVKMRNIAIEVTPISNQILRLVYDLRNHPASFYLSENLPVVISCDDPGFWNAMGVSYDYYYAFMAIASADADLRLLKQLVWNTIDYSMLTEAERKDAAQILNVQWDQFISYIINNNMQQGKKI